MSGGYSASSMLYIVAIFLVLYAVGMCIYLGMNALRKIRRRMKDSKEEGNG